MYRTRDDSIIRSPETKRDEEATLKSNTKFS